MKRRPIESKSQNNWMCSIQLKRGAGMRKSSIDDSQLAKQEMGSHSEL